MKKIIVVVLLLGLVGATLFAQNGFTVNGKLRTRMALYNGIGDGAPSNSWVDSRLRMKFANSFNANAKLVWQVEVGDLKWGTSPSADLGNDGINVETKHAYMQFKCPNLPINATIGLQAWNDHDSLVLDDDFPAMMFNTKVSNFDIQFGTAKFAENDFAKDDDLDLFFLNFASGKMFGMQNIIRRSNGGDNLDMWFMPYYCLNMDALSLDLKAVYNMGSYKAAAADGSDITNGGFAVALKAKYKTVANLGFDFLYTSGDDGSDAKSTTVFNSISEYYVNGLEIFGYGVNDSVEQGWAGNWDTGNGGLGLMSIVAHASYPLNNITVNAAAGMVNSVEKNENGKTAMGTEFDLGLARKLDKNVEFKLVGAYAIPGDGYFGDKVDNLYELSTFLRYSF